jgi:hypothetical protein
VVLLTPEAQARAHADVQTERVSLGPVDIPAGSLLARQRRRTAFENEPNVIRLQIVRGNLAQEARTPKGMGK